MRAENLKKPRIVTAITLAEKKSLGLTLQKGTGHEGAQRVTTPDKWIPHSLVFVNKLELLSKIPTDAQGIVILPLQLVNMLSEKPEKALNPENMGQYPGLCFLSVENFREGMAKVLAEFCSKHERWEQGIHPTASIAKSARVSPFANLGPYCIIGEFAEIGPHTTIAGHSVIEAEAIVGSHCFIHPKVVIGAQCQIGDRCEIHSGTVIGSDGFGYVPQKSGSPIKIPQIGNVILEEDVEIGANCAIDRATIGSTRIGKGTKLDNLVHIGHNCSIGSDGLIAAGFMVAGSTNIGSRFMTGGGSVVADHINIADNVTLGGRSAVTNDITEAGAYTGYPLEPLQKGLRTLTSLRNLSELRKEVADLRKRLTELE